MVTHQVTKRAVAVRIEYRFGFILAGCFLFCLVVAGYISYTLQFRVAGEQVIERSRVLLEMGFVMRSYTSKEIAPLIRQLGFDKFHPQIVPSYGAQTALAELRRRFPDYRYREASLNPTNIEDRATDWEVALLERARFLASAPARPVRRLVSGDAIGWRGLLGLEAPGGRRRVVPTDAALVASRMSA